MFYTRPMSQSPDDPKAQPVLPLTESQQKVIRLISLGCSAREAGWILGISASTADNHKWRAMTRLGITKVALLTRYAITSNISPLGDSLTAEEKARLDRPGRPPTGNQRQP